MHKYICYICDKEFKEITHYKTHINKNLCTFVSTNTTSENLEIQSYLYKLNKSKNMRSSIILKDPPLKSL